MTQSRGGAYGRPNLLLISSWRVLLALSSHEEHTRNPAVGSSILEGAPPFLAFLVAITGICRGYDHAS